MIIPAHPDLKISSNPQRREFLIPRLPDPSQEWRMFFLPIGPQKWPNCPVKGLWVWILGTQTPLCSAPRPKPFAGTPVGRVQDQDQDQDQEDEQEIVRSPSQPILVIASHPLNGWIWFGEGLRGYDNWQRCAASDFKQNEHGETAIPLKSVAATTPKSRAEEKLLRLI